MTVAHHLDDLRTAIESAGLTPPDQIIADGRIHRFPTNGKPKDDAGWYIAYDGELPAGAFGCFRSAFSETWRAHTESDLTPEQRVEQHRRIREAQRAAKKEREQQQEEAARRAADIWGATKPAPADHPYLLAKGIKPNAAIRLHKDRLVIPVRHGGDIVSLQFISADGSKKFLRGGRVADCYCGIGQPGDTIVICEGFATAASIREATGYAVAVAFSAGNLESVARTMRTRYPDARLIICGDNDASGTGQNAARKAAEAVGATVVIPAESGDFNDLACSQGLRAVSAVIESAEWPAKPDQLNDQGVQFPGEPAPSLSRTRNYELTDAGNAARFIRDHGDDVRFVSAWGWLCWDGTRWRRDDELQARERMLRTARNIYTEAAEATDPKVADAITSWAKRSQQAQRIAAALWCAQPYLRATTDEFDRGPMLLPVANGTIDLRTGELHSHRREHLATRVVPVWYDRASRCPTWLDFLERVLPDEGIRRFAQRAAGYSISGSTAEQVLFFLYGSGRNGKSVFIETLAALTGEYHMATRIDSLSVTKGGGIPSDIARLVGARLVTVSETPDGARLNEPLVKDLTGGDTISACFKYKEWFDFRPEFKLWIRGNHKPVIRGTDDGIWRRVLLIPFAVQIPEADVDPALPDKLHEELPGILAWAVDGALEWQRTGLQPPRTVADAVSEYRHEMDTFGEFIEDCCFALPHLVTTSKALYQRYQKWCDETGHQPLSRTRFGAALGARGFEKEKVGTIRWRGIGLADQSGQLDGLDTSPENPQSHARDSLFSGKGSNLSNHPNGESEEF